MFNPYDVGGGAETIEAVMMAVGVALSAAIMLVAIAVCYYLFKKAQRVKSVPRHPRVAQTHTLEHPRQPARNGSPRRLEHRLTTGVSES